MNGALFTLVNVEDGGQVFAWGMEIWFERETDEKIERVAVIYRHDPDADQETHGRHVSAELARNFYSRALPIDLKLVWQEPSWD
jgi:hypothetical protein